MATDTGTDAGEPADAGERFVPFLGQFFPESLGLAAVLALVALLASLPFLGPLTGLEHLATGFFELFELQMALVLLWVLSATVVWSRPVGRLLERLARGLPTSQAAAIYATGFLALLFGWVNWALGLVGGVLLGQRLCRRAAADGERVHYPLVLTAALLSLVVTNQGLSSPGALLMADAEGTTNFLVDAAGPLAVSEFLLAPVNAVPTAVLVVTLPLLLVTLAPDEEADRTELRDGDAVLDGGVAETLDYYTPPTGERTFADRLEQSRALSLLAVAVGAVSLVAYFGGGGELTLLWFLFALMMLGLLVQWRPMAFRAKTTHATRWANHLAVPFLLYAAAYVLLREAGLYEPLGAAIATAGGVGSFASAFAVGLFVPDPGSTWLLVGPALVAVEADLVRSVTAVMFGAGLSNLWLGFLFAGILGVRGFEYREFVKYAGVVSLYVVAVVVASMLVF